MHNRLFTIASLGLLSAACQAPDANRYNQSAGPPAPAYTAAPLFAPYAVPGQQETRPVEAHQAVVGQPVTRDEFGFRYDAYGNRVDRNGRIISPQSTTP